jgi:hypothetical protein
VNAGASHISANVEEGEDWDNNDAADLDAQAYLQDLADRPELHQTDVADAPAQEEEDYAKTVQQVRVSFLVPVMLLLDSHSNSLFV